MRRLLGWLLGLLSLFDLIATTLIAVDFRCIDFTSVASSQSCNNFVALLLPLLVWPPGAVIVAPG